MSERQHDPWADSPPWSDEGATAADAGPSSHGAMVGAAGDTAAAGDAGDGAVSPRSCPWCAAPAPPDASRCTSCGAALAQREQIGDLLIPGLTAVDPALKDLDGRPLHLHGPSPSQGVASGVVVAAAAGGPLGLTILGGVAAVAAAEYLGAGSAGTGAATADSVGETSAAVLQALEKLERGETLPASAEGTPRPEVAAGAQSADRDAVDPGVPEPARQEEEASDGV